MPLSYQLSGGGPWGFRLVGGKEFRTELSVSRVTPGGKAEKAGIKPGFVILEINGVSTKELTHLEAQNKIKSAGISLQLVIDNGGTKSTVAPAGSSSEVGYRATPKPSHDYVQSKPSYQKPATPASTYKPPPKVPAAPVAKAPAYDDPLPPPPPSLLSATAGNSGGDSDPVCEGCGKVIDGPYLSYKGKDWHADEFVCAARNCRKPLQNVGFVEENGERYCKDCYEKHFAHACAKCHQKIVGNVMHALNQTWHMTCFVCTACSQLFTDGVFQMNNDKPYCVNDYNRLFSQTCSGCNFTIDSGDNYLEALSAHWHEACFNCAVCHRDLKDVGFFAVSGKPVCSNHKNARIA